MTEADVLPLREALLRWCDPALVAGVLAEERHLTPSEIAGFHRGCLSAPHELRKPMEKEWLLGQPDYSRLIAAWQALERDLCRRMGRAELYLTGVQIRPQMATERRAIWGAWAAECEFDFMKDAVTVGEVRFAMVQASRMPQVAEPSRTGKPIPAAGLPAITAENVRALTDAEVLLLLEDHARRVVENDELKALDPGITKVSLMPLILRKMRARAAAGELMDSLTGEAAELEQWIQGRAPSYQPPTAGAIANSLRNHYRRLKA